MIGQEKILKFHINSDGVNVYIEYNLNGIGINNSNLRLIIKGKKNKILRSVVLENVDCYETDTTTNYPTISLLYQVDVQRKETTYTFWNILDTSSPDAPIYQVLRNAGIIT